MPYDLDQRPVGDSLAVREAAAGEQTGVGALGELADEPHLADPGRPEERHQLRFADLLGLGERGPELGDLTRTANER